MIKNKLLITLLVLGFLSAFFRVDAFTTSSTGYANNGVATANFIVSTDNNLILDISLPDPITDTVLAGSGTPTAGDAVITVNPWSAAAVPVFFYDDGDTVWQTANDGVFADSDSSGTYTVGDTQLVGSGTPALGSAIITANPWAAATIPVIFYDAGTAGTWETGSDGILTDTDSSGYYNADKISSVRISNIGTSGIAQDNEITAIKVWQEDGTAAGFQAGSDTLIGSKTSAPYWNQTITCSSAAVYTASSKDRLYVTVNISPNAINRRIIKASINTNYLQFVSTNDGPTDTSIVNPYFQIVLSQTTIDQKAPVSSISDPGDGAIITLADSYTVYGLCSDTGGSTVREVLISFDNGTTWQTVTPLEATESSGFTWKYVWQNFIIGTYNIKTRAEDWIGNIETPGEGVTVTVTSVEEAATTTEDTATTTDDTATTTEDTTTPSPDATGGAAAETPIEEMTLDELKEKIKEIQQQIILLLQQLIELVQEQIAGLEQQ